MENAEFTGYSAIAHDHAVNPRNFGILTRFNSRAIVKGNCGETMGFWLLFENDTIKGISFLTDGCGSSRACGSMAASLVEGKTLDDAVTLEKSHITDALGGMPPDAEHCASLAVETLRMACEDFIRNPGVTYELPPHAGDSEIDTNTTIS